MARIIRITSCVFLLCVIVTAITVTADDRLDELQCSRMVLAAAAQEKAAIAERQYAPDREADVLHIIIDVTPNFRNRTIAGTTTIKFAPISKPLTEFRLDAVGLDVSSVTSSAKIEG